MWRENYSTASLIDAKYFSSSLMNLKFACINSSLVCQEKLRAEDDGLWRNMNAIFTEEEAIVLSGIKVWPYISFLITLPGESGKNIQQILTL